MIPRYQKILFYGLIAGIILMAFFLFYERKRAHDRLTAQNDATPIEAPMATGTEPVAFDLASDRDGSVTAVERPVALPQEPSVRARALLERLMAEYALPKSMHPLSSGRAVDDVFLLSLPIATASTQGATVDTNAVSIQTGQLAVINLRGTFVENHPSGVQVETLTILSILGTLHANFPEITEVRFLVDGQPHETLAGHADLTRTYPAIDTTISPEHARPRSSAGDSPTEDQR